MDTKRIYALLHALRRYADQNNNILLSYIVDDLRDAIEGPEDVEGLNKTERDALKIGLRIETIKALRNRFLTSGDPRGTLQGAKEVVDAYCAKHFLNDVVQGS